MGDKIKLKISIDAEIFKEDVRSAKTTTLKLDNDKCENITEADIKEITKMITEKLKESLTISQVK